LSSLKKRIRRLIRGAGLDIRTLQPFSDDYETLVHIGAAIGWDVVVDVGANTGAFASSFFDAGFDKRIVSFEPLPEAHEILTRRSNLNPLWLVGPRVALGDKDGIASFNVSRNGSSSSLLPMEARHSEVAPASQFIKAIDIEIARLDTVAPPLLGSSRRALLKIDTQGTELDVIRGASGILERIAAIRVELSFERLYAGQELFDEVYAHITGLGFSLWEISPVLRDPATGQMLQCDGTFVRK